MRRRYALPASVLAASLALAGCGALPAFTSYGQVALLALAALSTALLVYGVARQRTARDDRDAQVLRALPPLLSVAPVALYAYDRSGTYTYDLVGDAFPLDWRTGALSGHHYLEAVPEGPDGDEARAAYADVLSRHEPRTYERAETGRDGLPAVVRYHHVPGPDGGGIVHAYAVTSYAARAERAEAAASQAEARLRELTADLSRVREERAAERVMRERLDAVLKL
jgi:hypothetical protein